MSATNTQLPTILFVQGAGSGAYAVDQHLASSLQDALGSAYDVRYPEMPNEADPEYGRWKERIGEELAATDDRVILLPQADDDVVPFEYFRLYKALLPQATFREYDGREHQFDNDLTEVAKDIERL